MPVEQQPPEVLALVIADHVHRDDLSPKLYILGTRFSLRATTFPWVQRALAIYSVFTDGRGETPIRLRLVDVDESREPVVQHETALTFTDPIADLEVVFLLTDLVFPEPGDYRLQLCGAGQLLRERRLLVEAAAAPGQ